MSDDQKKFEINTSNFEDALDESEFEEFTNYRSDFKTLIYDIVAELDLTEQIEHLNVCEAVRGRAEIWRESSNPWPSRRLNLDIYACRQRYMDEKLIRHEFGHEADRHNPAMRYNPAIEYRWKEEPGATLFHLIVNVSLDSRLAENGLGKDERRKEFDYVQGKYSKYFEAHPDFYENTWNAPPLTWPEMEALTKELIKL